MTNFTKPIFQTRINYNDRYPKYKGIKEFDLHRKQLLYGRIDRDGNAIYLHDANLDQIWTGEESTEFAVDFVCDAFERLKNHVRKVANNGRMDTNSLFTPAGFRVRHAWRSGDLEYNYYRYLNKLYTDFVQNYLEVNRRYEEITDFNSFLISFSKYMSSIAYYFPLTKTGYILSYHCSPFISGMMISVANEKYGMKNSKKALKYTTDSNFTFIKNAAKKFGFMMDRNAPWRLVFNVASGGLKDKYELGIYAPPTNKNPGGGKIPKDEKELTGAAYFMNNYGVSFSKGSSHVFDKYYIKAHMEEVENLRNYLFLFYSAFYTQFSSFTKIEVHGATKHRLACNAKLKLKYLNRNELPGSVRKLPGTDAGTTYQSTPVYIPEMFNQMYTDQFWLNYVLKFRLLETASPHDIQRYRYFQKHMLDTYKAFGTRAALNYINDLTKGFFATKFIQEGEYWYGQTKTINEARREFALENVGSDAHELTGVLNKPK
tara:strand:+ start:5842 stop:7302 length:1461 start_codon:yes stop_codon:yes gene_type:complete